MSLDPAAPPPALIGLLGVPDTARGFLCDLDGVLAQTAKQHAAAWKPVRYVHTARRAGLVATREGLAGKPEPDTFLAGARLLGVPAQAAVVFEDALAGVAAGRAGHFGYVIGVNRVGQADALRAHGADVVVSDLAELLERP